MASDIPAGDGKIIKLFVTVLLHVLDIAAAVMLIPLTTSLCPLLNEFVVLLGKVLHRSEGDIVEVGLS